MGKNIQKVQDMVDGNFKAKIQSGYTPTEKTRIEGEIWIDANGTEWKQRNGYRVKVSKFANRGIADQCNTCESFIIKGWDKDTYKADGRCYHCQLNYELDLKFDAPIRHFAWRRLKDFENMEALEKDFLRWLDEKQKLDKEKIFDKSVANAMANANVEMTVNKNKAMTK